MINIGILGAGRIGKVHATAVNKFSNIQLKSIADPYLDEAWAKSMGITNLYKDVNEIINDNSIDAVYICTPTDTHADLIIQAALNGKAIFCEKPVDLDIEKILEVKKVLEQTGVLFQIGFNRRFDANFKKMKTLVNAGEVGKLITLKVVSRDPSAPPIEYVKSSGGLFLDMTIHDFDIVRFISNEEVIELSVQAGNFVSDYKDIDIDTAMINLKLKSGAFAMIENCRATTYGYDQRVEVFGEKANIKFENIFEDNVVTTNTNGTSSSKPLDFFLERYEKAYENETYEFVNSLVNKKGSCVGIEDALESALLAVGAKIAFEEKRTVTMNEIRNKFNIGDNNENV
jgi:myo-inositol 2-dehydrogenase/D-chiro-inositol 1-dehydrogenase